MWEHRVKEEKTAHLEEMRVERGGRVAGCCKQTPAEDKTIIRFLLTANRMRWKSRRSNEVATTVDGRLTKNRRIDKL